MCYVTIDRFIYLVYMKSILFLLNAHNGFIIKGNIKYLASVHWTVKSPVKLHFIILGLIQNIQKSSGNSQHFTPG